LDIQKYPFGFFPMDLWGVYIYWLKIPTIKEILGWV
jgi:hypothetical protein